MQAPVTTAYSSKNYNNALPQTLFESKEGFLIQGALDYEPAHLNHWLLSILDCRMNLLRVIGGYE